MENLNNEFERLKEAINIQKIKALTDRAATLYNGETIDYYGEYISVTSPAQEDAANKIIATLYDEIEPYLQQIETCKHFFDRTEWDALDYVINVYKQTVRYVIEYNNQQASNKAQEEHHKAEPSKRGRQAKGDLHKIMEWKTDKDAREIIDRAINKGLFLVEPNGLTWTKTAALYGYFIDMVSDRLNLKASNGRTQWKTFGFITNHTSLLNTARQAVNGYKNKGLQPPEGDDIVNDILK